MRSPSFISVFATLYLVLYCLLLQLEATEAIAMLMMFFSPLVVGWMIYVVLKFGRYTGAEFSEEDEWGYQDYNKDDLGLL